MLRFHARNVAIRRIRARVEKIFGTWKRSSCLRHMRWPGLAKANLQVRLNP
jgi:IS5 family transposase